MTPDDRLIATLETLDNQLAACEAGDHSDKTHAQIISAIRWMAQHLDRDALFEFIDGAALQYDDVIKNLVSDSYFKTQ